MINAQGNESKTVFEEHLLQRIETLKHTLCKAEEVLHQNKVNSDFISDVFNAIATEDTQL